MPFHGVIGDGNTVSPATSPQLPDAASAAEFMVEKSNNAVAAAANRLARSIFKTFMEGSRTAHSVLPAGPDPRIAELAEISQQI
jgi:hypothetical protein